MGRVVPGIGVAAALVLAACLAAVAVTAAEPAASPERRVNPADVYETGQVSVAEGDASVAFRYRLLRPEPAPAAPPRRWPLVLFLHGAGERGTDNAVQLKFLPKWLADPEARRRHPCFVLVPQCRPNHRWAEVAWDAATSSPQPPAISTDLAAAVAALDDVLAREPVDPARVSLTGLSMGGYGAWDLAARMPERFAALVPICGGGDEATAPRLAALPIWCFHGAADNVVPVGRSRSMIEAVRAAGGKPRYSELEGVGHDAWTPAYRDPAVLDWLFEQSR